MNQKDLLLISITVFLTIIAWIVVEVKAISENTPTEAEISEASVEYTINTDILELLEQRIP